MSDLKLIVRLIPQFQLESEGMSELKSQPSCISKIFTWLISVISYFCGMFKYKLNVGVEVNNAKSELQGGNALEGIYKPKEVNNPEKIYATLQECRDTVGIKKTEGMLLHYFLQ